MEQRHPIERKSLDKLGEQTLPDSGWTNAPTMFALDASSGATLWSFASGASVVAGASIAGNTIYWGSGYAHLGIPGFSGNNKFYAFSVNGQ